jgi:hypothetical protein
VAETTTSDATGISTSVEIAPVSKTSARVKATPKQPTQTKPIQKKSTPAKSTPVEVTSTEVMRVSKAGSQPAGADLAGTEVSSDTEIVGKAGTPATETTDTAATDKADKADKAARTTQPDQTARTTTEPDLTPGTTIEPDLAEAMTDLDQTGEATTEPETSVEFERTSRHEQMTDTVELHLTTDSTQVNDLEPIPEGVPELESQPEPGTTPELKITPGPRAQADDAAAGLSAPTPDPQQATAVEGTPVDAVEGDEGTPVVAVGGKKRPARQRKVRPLRAARNAGRNTVDWSRRPNGRLILPAIFAVLLVVAAGTAGVFLVPRALKPTATNAVSQQLPVESTPPKPGAGSSPIQPSLPPINPGPTGTAGPVQAGARPADALTGWAEQVGTRVGVPVVAVQAYGYAELVLRRTQPSCHLSWTTLAAIGKVESAHGSANGAVLGADGMAMPAIVGLPLDGKGGRQLIRDTDGGSLDTDRTFDRAMGPLQFVPTTWRENAVDADNNGITDPNDIDDASLAAATYLCRDGRDLAKPEDWWEGILSYNDVRPYAQKVFTEANAYGVRSRT